MDKVPATQWIQLDKCWIEMKSFKLRSFSTSMVTFRILKLEKFLSLYSVSLYSEKREGHWLLEADVL